MVAIKHIDEMLIPRNSPAFQQLSDTNRGPLIIITTYIFLICSFLAIIVKIWTRVATARSLAWTDHYMLAAALLALCQSISLTISVNHGLGEHEDALSSQELDSASKALYAANILTVATLAAAKASILMLITGIQPLKPVLIGCWVTMGVVGAWMVAGIFALAFQCELPKPWTLGPETCGDQQAIRIGIGAVNILTDFAIVLLAFLMMRTTQVASSKKWAVVALFGLRIATPPFAICALVYYNDYYSSDDRTWHAALPLIWTQIMLHVSIITACIPSIKRFLADVQSGLMGATISEQYEMTHSGGKPTQVQSGSRSGTSTGMFGSRLASRINGVMSSKSQGVSGVRSQSEKVQLESTSGESTFGHSAFAKHGNRNQMPEETESVKGLASNAIHQKIDYEVEYEERNNHEREWSDDGKVGRTSR